MGSLLGQFQTAYVTTDIDRAAALFKERYDVGPFMMMELDFEVMKSTGPAQRKLKIGLCWSGDSQFELIQPISGDIAIYKDPLPAEGFGLLFHHIAVRIGGDEADWKNLIASFAAQGREVVFTGEAGHLRYLYTDESKTLGHYVEYIQISDEGWAGWKSRS